MNQVYCASAGIEQICAMAGLPKVQVGKLLTLAIRTDSALF